MKIVVGRRHGFTLLELLVVIAIVAVLSALAFMLLGRGRESARAARCVGNVRQLCAAHVVLAQENSGFIVHPYRSAVLGSWNRDWSMFHTILAHGDLGWRAPGDDVRARLRTMDHLQCPTAHALRKTEMQAKDTHGGWRTYMVNGRIGADKEPSAADRGWIDGAQTLSGVAAPEKLVFVSERVWNGTQYPTAGGPYPGDYGYADFHRGGFHVGYMDGHVERKKPDEFLLGGVTLPDGRQGKWSNPEFALMWRGQLFKRAIPQ